MKLYEALKEGVQFLSESGIESARSDARELLYHSFALSTEKYAIEKNEPCDEARLELFKKLCKKRADGYPLQYILGSWDFYGREFYVDEGCLIPREETELIVKVALDLDIKNCNFADLCTGSGCIGISYALENRSATGLLCDISDDALRVSEKNLSHHKVLNRVETLKFDVFTDELPKGLSLIMSNPPYINARDMKTLEREVLCEPSIALFGGDDGLDFYRVICKKHFHSLCGGGYIVFEVGYDQAEDVSALLSAEGATDIQIFTDLYGVKRAVLGKKKD